MTKRVLITGGAGFIGSALIKELLPYGHEIFVIDDLSFGNREFIVIDDRHFFEDSILDRERMMRLMEDIRAEWVIHLAAVHFIPYCNQHPYESSNINIQGTINIYDAAREVGGVERMFFASTAAVYPICDEAVAEDHALGPIDIYGLSKLAGERLTNEYHLQTGVPSVVCRFFNAFGPNETNAHLIPDIQDQINVGERTIKLGNLTPRRDFIHTYDMARAVRMLMGHPMKGIETYNLGRGIEYSVTEIVEAFERELGEDIKIEQEESRIRKVERMHLLADVTKLKQATGWEPEWGLDEGIRTLVQK